MHDIIQKTVDEIFARHDREQPLRREMDNLYQENLNLLAQERKLEAEVKEQRKLMEVWKIRIFKISPIRAQIEKNKSKIDHILGRLIAGV